MKCMHRECMARVTWFGIWEDGRIGWKLCDKHMKRNRADIKDVEKWLHVSDAFEELDKSASWMERTGAVAKKTDVAAAWLNGRLVSPITVIHNEKLHKIWTLSEARRNGLTIEAAVGNFCDAHGIDAEREIEYGPQDQG